MRILALESSCDETACAVVEDAQVLSSVVSSQIAVHRAFGGVVPELASRHHVTSIVPVVREAMARAGLAHAWASVDAVAVTEGPGLMGALLVGVQLARGLAAALGRPLYGIHHLEGHLWSAFLGDEARPATRFVPHLALIVSGGHTELVDVQGLGRYHILGRTRDDAVGEAYDKVGKMLGLGYPGGPMIDRLAQEGDPVAIRFPRSMLHQDNDAFSFAGLKTAVLVHLEKGGAPRSRAELTDICASFQAAVIDVLVGKACRARRVLRAGRLHVVGGVAANRGLRAAMASAAARDGFEFGAVPLRYCGDNAAMIGAAAAARAAAGARPSVYVSSSASLDSDRVAIT
ncbi:MAG: tRNA (adenosine(37)-N6)-threonylcarbamoyltransferase complex transferase subunit TsaD [Nannocystaceae bacterium]